MTSSSTPVILPTAPVPAPVTTNLMAATGSSMPSSSIPATLPTAPASAPVVRPSSLSAATGPLMASSSSGGGLSAASLSAATGSSMASSSSGGGLSASALGGGIRPINDHLKYNFDQKYPPLTDFDESKARLVDYVDAIGGRKSRSLVRNMMAPDESRVLTVTSSLDPATNGVRTKSVAERGVMQGDTVYRNFNVSQDLVMSNTAVDSERNEVVGVSMVTQGEHVEGDPISFAVAFAGSTSLIFRGFKLTDESPYTAEPGHRFGLDFSSAAHETGRVDGITRCVNVHRRARGAAGFRSSYFTALSSGVPGYKIHSLIDF